MFRIINFILHYHITQFLNGSGTREGDPLESGVPARPYFQYQIATKYIYKANECGAINGTTQT